MDNNKNIKSGSKITFKYDPVIDKYVLNNQYFNRYLDAFYSEPYKSVHIGTVRSLYIENKLFTNLIGELRWEIMLYHLSQELLGRPIGEYGEKIPFQKPTYGLNDYIEIFVDLEVEIIN